MPDQAPVKPLSVCPAAVVPEITGRESFDGRVGGVVGSSTLPVGAEIAGLRLGWVLLAISSTRIVAPTFAAVSVYVCEVAPAIAEQLLPELPQRSH